MLPTAIIQARVALGIYLYQDYIFAAVVINGSPPQPITYNGAELVIPVDRGLKAQLGASLGGAQLQEYDVGAARPGAVQASLRYERELSRHLRMVRAAAELQFGGDASHVVLTAPVYYIESQRRAMKAAARAAGMVVLAIVNEPAAAGFSAVTGLSTGDTAAVVVRDKSSVQVAVLQRTAGMLKVLSVAGNAHLDSDALQQQFLATQFDGPAQHVYLVDDDLCTGAELLDVPTTCLSRNKIAYGAAIHAGALLRHHGHRIGRADVQQEHPLLRQKIAETRREIDTLFSSNLGERYSGAVAGEYGLATREELGE